MVCIHEQFSAGDLGVSRIWDDELGACIDVGPETLVYPVMEAMVTGWSWALFFCNKVCTEALVRYRQPISVLCKDNAVCSVYADNFVALAGSQAAAEEAYDGFVEACAWRGLRLLGSVIDCKWLVYQKPRRVWRVHLATNLLLRRRRVRGPEVQVVVGHFVHLFGLCRPALSVFQATYKFFAE